MNTRWKSLFLAVFSACLLAGSVNARVCFLADLECQKGQSQPVVVDEGEKPCTERPEYSGETLVLEEDQCSAMEYTNWVCKDSTGYHYKEKGCKAGYIDLEAYAEDGVKNRDKYNCSVVECGRCCLLENTSCPRDYKLCEDPMEPSDNSNNDSCVDKDGNILFKLCECKDEYNIKTQECKRLGLNPGEVCGIYTNDCSCPDGYTFVTQNPDPNACPAECDGNGCTRKKQPINVAFPGKKGMCISDEVECKDPPYGCNSANGEYKTAEECVASMLHAVCTQDSNNCWQVTGCETTSLGYQQTLVGSDAYCFDMAKDTSCARDDAECFEACNCVDEQNCSVSYDMKKDEDNKQYCEPECTTLGYMECRVKDNFDAEDSSKYCRNSGNNRFIYYYLNCIRKNMCYPIDSINPREGYEVAPLIDASMWGVCELVLTRTEAEEGGYITNGQYYEADNCNPLINGVTDTSQEYLRLHSCTSSDFDCAGNLPAPYGDEDNEEPGWKTADVDDDTMANGKRCLNLTQNGEQIMFGTTLDGTRVECGGKEYITDCKCTTFNAGKPEGCKIRILEAPLSKSGIRIPALKIEAGDVVHCNNETGKCGSDETGDLQVFTGELVPGCANAQDRPAFTLVYAYFRAPDSNEKCLSSAPIDEMTDFCTGEEVCIGTVLSESEAGIRCTGKCGTEGNCDEGYICTEATFYNERSACTGECVRQACPSGQVCKEATTVTDEFGERKYCKPENCMEEPKPKCNSGYYCKKAIDPITEKEYCESNECIDGCKEYATDKKIPYDKPSEACFMMPGNMSYGSGRIAYKFILPGTTYISCFVQRKCQQKLPKNEDGTLTDCAKLFTGVYATEVPEDYTRCSSGVCVKNADCPQCGEYFFSSGGCCTQAKNGDTLYGDKDIFLAAKNQASDDHTYEDVTGEYYSEYTQSYDKVHEFDNQIGCYYVRKVSKKYSTCEEYSDYVYSDGKVKYTTNEETLQDYYFVTKQSFDALNGAICYVYYQTCNVKSNVAKNYQAKTETELNCPTGQEPDQNGLIPECPGYYKKGTQCVCPNKESDGLYLNKAGDDGYYSVENIGIEGCEYYAKCTTPDGYVTEEECKNAGKVVPTGGQSISRCNTTYYQGSCVCPDLSDKGCYHEGTSGIGLTYPVTGKIPNVSDDCKYVAACMVNSTNCVGGQSPIVSILGEEKHSYQWCIDNNHTVMTQIYEGTECGGPYYSCHENQQN